MFEKTNFEIEEQQEIVPVETDSDISEDKNDDIQSRIRALPKSSKFSIPMKNL